MVDKCAGCFCTPGNPGNTGVSGFLWGPPRFSGREVASRAMTRKRAVKKAPAPKAPAEKAPAARPTPAPTEAQLADEAAGSGVLDVLRGAS